jgi:hypothetical protein
VDLFQKLFLCSIIAFIAPHTSVQVIVAAMFSFGYVLLTIQVKPFREPAYNQLVALSQARTFWRMCACMHVHACVLQCLSLPLLTMRVAVSSRAALPLSRSPPAGQPVSLPLDVRTPPRCAGVLCFALL